MNKTYILAFAIGLFLIMGIAFAGELLNKSSTASIDNANLLAIKSKANVTRVNPTISNAVCDGNICKICAYQRDIIDDCFYVNASGQDETQLRATADKWVAQRLDSYGAELVKQQTKSATTKVIEGDLTINGK